jgi:hypothetical protein
MNYYHAEIIQQQTRYRSTIDIMAPILGEKELLRMALVCPSQKWNITR